MRVSIVSISLFICLWGCKDDHTTPRPRAYPRVEYPKQELQPFSQADCPFSFQFPTYAEVQQKEDHTCWFDISMPVFKAKLHCSYLPVEDRAHFDDMVNDTYTIAAKINERSNYMEE